MCNKASICIDCFHYYWCAHGKDVTKKISAIKDYRTSEEGQIYVNRCADFLHGDTVTQEEREERSVELMENYNKLIGDEN